MFIQEVIKTGRPFKRKKFPTYIDPKEMKNYFSFTLEDLMADDWEVRTQAEYWLYKKYLDNDWCVSLFEPTGFHIRMKVREVIE